MKKITLLLSCVCLFAGAKAQTFSDDFESYTLAKLGPQSPDWRTWSGAGGGTDDVMVVNTDNHTAGGAKSIYFSSTSSTGGPTDCVLPFSTSPLTTGHFNFTAWFKVPTGKTAYFNFQGATTMGNLYTLDCFMDNTGAISIQNSGTQVLAGTHPFGTWFQLQIDVNLNTNTWNLLIDGSSQGTWTNATDQIYAIDIYPADASAKYWVDDVSYTVTPYSMPSLNGAGNMIGVTNGLVGQSRPASFTMRNLGTTAITSFDVSMSQNGGAPVTQSVTGVNIASSATYTVNLSTPFTLAAGVNTFTATISNVNGMGTDNDTTDDVISTSFTPVMPASGKVVVGEEGTGTWCQWCPRGAVYMDMLTSKYAGYYAGIAVHNSDPMTLTAYDTPLSAMFSGYPSALVDRGTVIDPSQLEDYFLQRVVVAPAGFIQNGATWDPASRQLRVSVTTTLQQNITGNYKMICVLTEDSVSGTASSYNQQNAYSGGANGAMGGFESLPNPVPASLMNYNHVARAINPSFTGMANAYGTSAVTGQVFTHNFTFTLPAAWDANQIHIIGMMVDPAGTINNAGTATITEAVNNGYVSGISVGVNELTDGPDAIRLMPNPASDLTNISLNLKTESDLSVEVYSANGALVASKNYGRMSGAYLLPVETQNFTNGIYFVKVSVDGQPTLLKLVKQ